MGLALKARMGARAHSTLVLYSIVVGANQYRLNSVFNYQRFGLNSFSNGYQRHQYLRAEQIIVKLSFLQFSIFTTWPWSSLLQSRNMTNQTDFVETLYIYLALQRRTHMPTVRDFHVSGGSGLTRARVRSKKLQQQLGIL